MKTANVSDFKPFSAAKNVRVSKEGFRVVQDRWFPSQYANDFSLLLKLIEARLAKALDQVLPNLDRSGRKASAEVLENFFQYSLQPGLQLPFAMLEMSAPYLLIARHMIGRAPKTKEQIVLCVFVDVYLQASLKQSFEKTFETDVFLFSREDKEAAKQRVVILPWHGDFGAKVSPFESILSAIEFFGSGDVVVFVDTVCATIGKPSNLLGTIKFSDKGLADLKGLLGQCRDTMPSAEPGLTIAGAVSESLTLVVDRNGARFRVSATAGEDGKAAWVFRFMPFDVPLDEQVRDYGSKMNRDTGD
jgi:hypothetical protein